MIIPRKDKPYFYPPFFDISCFWQESTGLSHKVRVYIPFETTMTFTPFFLLIHSISHQSKFPIMRIRLFFYILVNFLPFRMLFQMIGLYQYDLKTKTLACLGILGTVIEIEGGGRIQSSLLRHLQLVINDYCQNCR